MAVAEGDGRVLLFCHGGCEVEAILNSIGLELADLFDQPLDHSRDRVRRPWSANDVLEVVMDESAVIAVIASDMLEGRVMTDADWKRLAQASQRLDRLATMVRT